MKMINRIKSHNVLAEFVEDECCENSICVTFDESYTNDDYAIIKVDKFYNSLNIERRPASVDCLIVRKCDENGFGLTLVELKNIKTGRGFKVKNMRSKFDTTLNDFIKNRFNDVLDIDYENVKLFFVTQQDVYRRKRDLGLKMEVLMDTRFSFNGKKIMIRPRMPNPSIKKCYSK